MKARTEGRSLCGHWGLLRAQPLATSLGRPGTSQKEQARQRLVEGGWPEAVSESLVERPMMEDFPVIIICCYLSSAYCVLGTGPKHFAFRDASNFPRGRCYQYYYPIWQFEAAWGPGTGSGRARIISSL